ncbi:aspartate/glutamate racemase family protein [Vreelandella olivaria]|uniref:aspartate/glutamate racemase family protein n=1 Tax=Vreelandella olivaria TaxID=390919 RepID=UPI00201F62BE|nr:aspartate/glutamate racemase family protein [Halomonas olivaria]
MGHVNHSRTNSRHFLVINPNTNVNVTASIRQTMVNITPPDVTTEVTSPSTGPHAIESQQDKNVATQQVLTLIKQRQEETFAGYIMACFDDIAITEARAITQRPVISLAEASMRSAATAGGIFTVITTFDNAVPTIVALSESYGLGQRCRVVATGIGVTDTAAQTERAEERLHTAITTAIQCGSKAIVLGSGAFAGRAQTLSEHYHIDVTDGFREALEYTMRQPYLADNASA